MKDKILIKINLALILVVIASIVFCYFTVKNYEEAEQITNEIIHDLEVDRDAWVGKFGALQEEFYEYQETHK